MKKWIPHLGVLFFFFLLVSIITYPLIFSLSTLTTGRGDELLIAWIHAWGFHALTTSPLDLFNANIFYPFLYSFAYSDIHLTSMLVGSIPYLFLKEPIVFNNISLISSLTLLGFSLYLCIYVITKEYLPGLFTGVLVIFSPAVLDKAIHLQVLFIFFLPLGMLSLVLFLTKKQTRYLVFALLCFFLQSINSFMAGYFVLLSYLCIGGIFLLTKQFSFYLLFQKKHLAIFLLTGVLLIPFIYPYLKVSKEYQYQRDIRDTIHFSLSPEDYFYPNSATRLEQPLRILQKVDPTKTNAEYKVGYIGGVFTFLVLVTVIFFIRTKTRSPLFIGLFATAVLGFLLSLGPFLHLGRMTIHHPFPIPLPYLLFYYLFPGFNGFRSSARFEMLFIVAIAVCIGIVLSLLFKHVSGRIKTYGYGILLGLVVLEFSSPFSYVNSPQITHPPIEYQWLQNLPEKSVLIHFPIYTWNMPQAENEFYRVYYSTISFHSQINGTSGYSPKKWEEQAHILLGNFPNEETISTLKEEGVEYILLHSDEYDVLSETAFMSDGKKIKKGSEVTEEMKTFKQLQLIQKGYGKYLYKLL